MKKAEVVNAILKGLGRKPTGYLLRWSPTLKEPFRFDLLEVWKCNVDGGVVTRKSAQSPLPSHLGHEIGAPKVYSLWELMKVQMRVIR